jgi:hypothetical protein
MFYIKGSCQIKTYEAYKRKIKRWKERKQEPCVYICHFYIYKQRSTLITIAALHDHRDVFYMKKFSQSKSMIKQ